MGISSRARAIKIDGWGEGNLGSVVIGGGCLDCMYIMDLVNVYTVYCV